MQKYENSIILIVNNINDFLEELLPLYEKSSLRIIRNEEKEEFLISQANLAIKEAYISSNKKKYIFLCGNTFRKEAQNALLKVLEEPPLNIIFILLTTSKSSILPTLYSRLPYKYLKYSSLKEECPLDIKNLDLKDIYHFLKENQRISVNEAKNLVESILFKLSSQKINLNEKQLELFSNSIKLLDLNSKGINVLSLLLLSLLDNKRL